MEKLEKIVVSDPAYDKSPKDNRNGIQGKYLKFLLKGSKGVVEFLTYTHLSGNKKTMSNIGYHSYTQMYAGQKIDSESCKYLDGKPCYYDGSVVRAKKVFNDIFLQKGEDGLWEYLEKYYIEIFGS